MLTYWADSGDIDVLGDLRRSHRQVNDFPGSCTQPPVRPVPHSGPRTCSTWWVGIRWREKPWGLSGFPGTRLPRRNAPFIRQKPGLPSVKFDLCPGPFLQMSVPWNFGISGPPAPVNSSPISILPGCRWLYSFRHHGSGVSPPGATGQLVVDVVPDACFSHAGSATSDETEGPPNTGRRTSFRPPNTGRRTSFRLLASRRRCVLSDSRKLTRFRLSNLPLERPCV